MNDVLRTQFRKCEIGSVWFVDWVNRLCTLKGLSVKEAQGPFFDGPTVHDPRRWDLVGVEKEYEVVIRRGDFGYESYSDEVAGWWTMTSLSSKSEVLLTLTTREYAPDYCRNMDVSEADYPLRGALRTGANGNGIEF